MIDDDFGLVLNSTFPLHYFFSKFVLLIVIYGAETISITKQNKYRYHYSVYNTYLLADKKDLLFF